MLLMMFTWPGRLATKEPHLEKKISLDMVMMLFRIREDGQNSWKLIYLINGQFLVLHGGKWFYMIEQFIQWSHYTGYRPVISSCRTQYIFAGCFCVVYLCVSWLCDFCFALVCHLTISLCLCVLYFVQPCFADPALRLCDVQHVQ